MRHHSAYFSIVTTKKKDLRGNPSYETFGFLQEFGILITLCIGITE